MAAAYGGHTLAVARERFFARGEAPRGLVSEVILRSWQRCASLGLDAQSRPRPEPLTAGSLRAARERNEALQRSCRPGLESLAGDARATDSVVLLTDASGLVLDSCGSEGFVSQAARVALRPGVNWQEASAGTNAIGTALEERRAVEVRGAEHFFEPHRIISCFAAPILDPQGRTVGALDLSGHASVAHTHALGMVQLAVDQVEHRFFDQLPAGCEVVRLHADAALLGTAHEGVLVFFDRRLSGANRHGLRLLGLGWQDIGRADFARLFASDAADLNGLSHIALHDGTRLHVRGELRKPAPRPAARPTTVAGDVADRPLFDEALQRELHAAVAMLDADLAVLIEGETGVGKEVFARRLHALSSWHEGPFVTINCAALPASLVESELFGYAPGAFTGARREGATGLLRQAQGGVLLLDEIGDMPLELQSRLLRVLQEREVSPLGAGKPTPVQFALVASTNRSLRSLVDAGQFRADLYYRIAHHAVRIQPLREHPALRTLITALWEQLGGTHGASLPGPVIDLLAQASWPGNFRQLLNALRVLRVHAARGEPLQPSLLSPAVWPRSSVQGQHADGMPGGGVAAAGAGGSPPLIAVEEDCMRTALAACQGNVSAAARRLGISRSTLYRRLGL